MCQVLVKQNGTVLELSTKTAEGSVLVYSIRVKGNELKCLKQLPPQSTNNSSPIASGMLSVLHWKITLIMVMKSLQSLTRLMQRSLKSTNWLKTTEFNFCPFIHNNSCVTLKHKFFRSFVTTGSVKLSPILRSKVTWLPNVNPGTTLLICLTKRVMFPTIKHTTGRILSDSN